VNVGLFSEDSCYVQGLGQPRRRGSIMNGGTWTSEDITNVNLGFCNHMNYLGSVMHEIGHILGMNHEHKRPDSSSSYHGHGPHLQVYWQNVPADWTAQMTTEESSYTGSAEDGAGDPWTGFAPYDFESIMHYSTGDNWYATIPASSISLVGQRTHITEGDSWQINDMYQCKIQANRTVTVSATFALDLNSVDETKFKAAYMQGVATAYSVDLSRVGNCSLRSGSIIADASIETATVEEAQALTQLGASASTVVQVKMEAADGSTSTVQATSAEVTVSKPALPGSGGVSTETGDDSGSDDVEAMTAKSAADPCHSSPLVLVMTSLLTVAMRWTV